MTPGSIQLGALFKLKVWQPLAACPPGSHLPCPTCKLATQRTTHNIMTSGGLVAVASAFNWSGVFAQNSAIGGSFGQANALSVTAGTNDIYGAVGTNTTVPQATDTILGTEVARLTISNANTSLNTATWDFFFGIGVAAGVLAEIGVFANATSIAGSGILLDHASLSPTVTVTVAQTVTFEAVWSFGQG